jgi:hypothetical protein
MMLSYVLTRIVGVKHDQMIPLAAPSQYVSLTARQLPDTGIREMWDRH